MKTPLEYAIAEHAAGVTEKPGNRGIPFERYGLPGEQPLAWCARFLRWCFIQAGTPLPGNKYEIGNVAYMLTALSMRTALVPAGVRVEPGDLLFLRDRGKSDPGAGRHVAIVVAANDVAVETVDGNWGNKIQRVHRERSLPSIDCYARWPVRMLA